MEIEAGAYVEPEAHVVVGICVTDEGIEAFGRLIDEIGAMSRLSIVCVHHFNQVSPSKWMEGLAARSSLSFAIPKNKAPLEPGLVYVCPTNQKVQIKGGAVIIDLFPGERERPSVIDDFFHSLAEDQGKRAVAIELSGEGAIAKLGLQAILDHGGLAFSQTSMVGDLESIQIHATESKEPRAISTTEIAMAIRRIAPYLPSNEDSAELQKLILEQIDRAIPLISDLLKKVTDHSFHDYKRKTLNRRIQRRMQLVKITDVDDYVSYLKDNSKEVKALFRDLLIGVTNFFRDPEAFDFLQENVLSKIFANRSSDETIRIWVAGCSTGEEAYTLAIMCAEILDQMESPPALQIFASDIDDRALAVGRAGSYSRAIEKHVSAKRLKRFFTVRGDGYEVNQELRSLILFSLHNLTSDPPFSRLDLITCRNLMIYLGEHSNEKIIPLFHYALNAGGYLMLGPSENISANNEYFRTVDVMYRIAQRKEMASGSTKGLEIRQGRLARASNRLEMASIGMNSDSKFWLRNFCLGHVL